MVNPTVKKYALAGLQLTITYSLCVFYSSLVALAVLYDFITKRHTRFWVPKKHEKPDVLSDPRYGEHKFITVNVSVVIFDEVVFFSVSFVSYVISFAAIE